MKKYLYTPIEFLESCNGEYQMYFDHYGVSNESIDKAAEFALNEVYRDIQASFHYNKIVLDIKSQDCGCGNTFWGGKGVMQISENADIRFVPYYEESNGLELDPNEIKQVRRTYGPNKIIQS